MITKESPINEIIDFLGASPSVALSTLKCVDYRVIPLQSPKNDHIADLHSFRFDNEECTISVSMVKTVWL